MDVGVNWFAQTFEDGHRKGLCYLKTFQPFFSSPSRVLALQGYAREVEASECLGKTIDLVDMGACASFLVLNAPEIFERCFVFLV